jgi:hypothetical protein
MAVGENEGRDPLPSDGAAPSFLFPGAPLGASTEDGPVRNDADESMRVAGLNTLMALVPSVLGSPGPEVSEYML